MTSDKTLSRAQRRAEKKLARHAARMVSRSLRIRGIGPDGANCVTDARAIQPVRQVGTQALSRASGAPLVSGNGVRILKNAAENFPAWLEAIHAAKKVVYFENYIF